MHLIQGAITCILTNIVQSHVLLAVNVEDFRNLANKFLSKHLADKLTHLVSESAGAKRRDDMKAGESNPDIDLNKFAEIVRDKVLSGYKSGTTKEKVNSKGNSKVKRFNTVTNSDHVTEWKAITKDISRNPNYGRKTPGPIYVKDELDSLLQTNNNEQTNDVPTQFDYAGIKSNENDENSIQETTNSKKYFDVTREEHTENQGDIPIKIDYTETKLGEWLYNHIISQEPTKIQNHKGAKDINDADNTEILSNESVKVKNVQYVYETHLLGQNDKIQDNVENLAALRPKNKNTNDVNIQDQPISEHEYIMGPKLNNVYKKKPQNKVMNENYSASQTKTPDIEDDHVLEPNDYIKPIQANKDKSNPENIPFGRDQDIEDFSALNKHQYVKPNQEINKNMKHKNIAPEKDREFEDHQILDKNEYTKPIHGNKNTFNYENIAPDHQKEKKVENFEETKLKPSKIETKSSLYKTDEGSQSSIEEHITYNKYLLGPKDKQNYQEEPKRQLARKTHKQGRQTKHNNNNRVDPQLVDNSDGKMILESKQIFNEVKLDANQSTLRNKKGDSDTKISNDNDYDSDYKKIKSAYGKSKVESSLGETVEAKGEKEENYTPSKKSQKQPIAQNDMYKKFALSSETKYNKHSNLEPETDEGYVPKKPISGSIHKYDEVSKIHDEFSNTDRTKTMKKEKSNEVLMPAFEGVKLGSSSSEEIKEKHEEDDTFSKYSREQETRLKKTKEQSMEKNNIYEKKSLRPKHKELSNNRDNKKDNGYDSPGSKDQKSNEREIKKNDDYKETVPKKKNKEHKDLDKIEENDTYDKFSLSSKNKNTNDIEDTKGYKYGYNDNVSVKKNTGHKGLDKIEENDMYEKFSLGSKDNDSNNRKDKKDDVYGYKKHVSGNKNKNNRGVDHEEANNTYEKYSLGAKDKKNKDKILKKTGGDYYGHKQSELENKNKGDYARHDKNKQYDLYDKYSKDKNRNRDVQLGDDKYGFKELIYGKKNKMKGVKDDSATNEDLISKNNDRYLLKNIKKVKEMSEEVPPEGYAGDPRPDFKEVKPESIKAKTESLMGSVEEKGKPTKHFKMKGTFIPKRQFYKLSSPNYYKDLPRTVEKYNFDEPLPEMDRKRDKVAYLKREPARVNRKLKLPIFEKVT